MSAATGNRQAFNQNQEDSPPSRFFSGIQRLILPYERYIKGEEDKPLPLVKPRRQELVVQEVDGTAKATAGKRPKVTQDHKAPGEMDTFPKSPDLSLQVSASKEESAEPADQAEEERKREDEDEEELQLTVKEETVCGDPAEEKAQPCELSAEYDATERLSGVPADPQGYPKSQGRTIPDEDPAAEFHHSLAGQNRGVDVPESFCSVGKADPPAAKETETHVGLVLPNPKQNPPQATADEEESYFSYKTLAPPGGNAGIMSPLAKKKLLSQVSGCASPNSYSFAHANHNGQNPQAPGAAVSRPSVIQHAQSFKALENRKQEVTSELYQWAPGQPSHAVGPYPAEKQMGHPSHGPSFPNFYSTHPLLSLYRPGEPCLSREASFIRNGGTGLCFTPNMHPDRTGSGYRPPLIEETSPPCGEMPSDDQPTDLSLPKSFPHTPSSIRHGHCGLAHPAHHRDSASPLLQASSLAYHPKACRVPPMTVSAPRKPLDPLPLLQAPGKDAVLGRHSAGPARCGPQSVGAARPLRRSLEELERGPPEKKIRAVTPMHPVRARTPNPEAEEKLGDSFAEGLKYPLRTPFFPPLYPGVQETCDRLGASAGAGAGYPHPLQCLKSQAVVSPFLPPFALHSLMVQRQLLASAAAPHLYRHPGRASYGDLLHHGLFPMSALNPPARLQPLPAPLSAPQHQTLIAPQH
ncbi:hypothetical protein SKAU_G00159780 [Synaphobranchus kaupii]|uniref:AT-rich interactive domain-containing protein 5A n=1 Tax=Synaphobranchus kaupii TaxID=118154 RepID=A0A9Q1FI98_SYNKA|nr:hypothetical protein SKAU_G00159780 [Synaphobranchus kaupii]